MASVMIFDKKSIRGIWSISVQAANYRVSQDALIDEAFKAAIEDGAVSREEKPKLRFKFV